MFHRCKDVSTNHVNPNPPHSARSGDMLLTRVRDESCWRDYVALWADIGDRRQCSLSPQPMATMMMMMMMIDIYDEYFYVVASHLCFFLHFNFCAALCSSPYVLSTDFAIIWPTITSSSFYLENQ